MSDSSNHNGVIKRRNLTLMVVVKSMWSNVKFSQFL